MKKTGHLKTLRDKTVKELKSEIADKRRLQTEVQFKLSLNTEKNLRLRKKLRREVAQAFTILKQKENE